MGESMQTVVYHNVLLGMISVYIDKFNRRRIKESNSPWKKERKTACQFSSHSISSELHNTTRRLHDAIDLIWLILNEGNKRAGAPAEQRQRQSAPCTVSHSKLTSTWQCFSIFLPWLVSVFLLIAFILTSVGVETQTKNMVGSISCQVAKFQGEIRGQPCDASVTVILTLTSQAAVLISEPKTFAFFCQLSSDKTIQFSKSRLWLWLKCHTFEW